MRYEDISPPLRAFLAGHEAFRRLGFTPDQIFLLTARSVQHRGAISAFALLRAQKKEFWLECGPIPDGDEDAFEREHKRVVEAVRSGALSAGDLDRIWEESEPCRYKVPFMKALLVKGFRMPKTMS